MKIYKYLSYESFIKTLDKNTLKYSQPCIFNDPYDNRLPVLLNYDKAILKCKMQKHINNYINNNYSPVGDLSIQKRINQDYIQNKISKNELNNFPDEYIEKIIKEIESASLFELKKLYEKDFVCCFSKRNNNLLMWSHYADYHSGAVIEFDSNKIENDKVCEIKYSEDIPSVDLDKFLMDGDNSELLDYYDKNICCKSKCWEYEQEIRLVRHNFESYVQMLYNQLSLNNGHNEVDEDHYRFFNFSIDSVTGIYHGVNFPLQENNLRAFYDSFEQYKDIPKYKARLNNNSFSLLFDELK